MVDNTCAFSVIFVLEEKEKEEGVAISNLI